MSESTKISVEIESDLLNRFKEIYPQHGMIKWFINETFRNFVEIHNPKMNEDLRLSVEQALNMGGNDE